MTSTLIPIISIGAIFLGVALFIFFPKGDSRKNKAYYVFILGSATLIADWYFHNPDLLRETQGNLVSVLVDSFLKYVIDIFM